MIIISTLRKFLIIASMFLQLFSCTHSAPYEIKSPCVSAEVGDGSEANINPCVRRAINHGVEIA